MLTNEQINRAIAKQRGEYYENIRVVSISGGGAQTAGQGLYCL